MKSGNNGLEISSVNWRPSLLAVYKLITGGGIGRGLTPVPGSWRLAASQHRQDRRLVVRDWRPSNAKLETIDKTGVLLVSRSQTAIFSFILGPEKIGSVHQP